MPKHKSEGLRDLFNRNKSTANISTGSQSKWRTLLALALVYIIVIFNLNWAWGIFFLLILIPDLASGVTYFVEEIRKDTNPFIYWFVMSTWIVLCLLMFSSLFVDYSQFY